jgi:hypothetical protein
MQNIEWEYTEKQVSPWGGMRLMKELLDNSGIREELKKLPLPYPRSNRGYSPIAILESYFVSIWIGASNFIQSSYLRYDEVLKEIFGWKEVASYSTFSRFFHKFSQKRNNEVFPQLNKWFFEQLAIDNITLDLDSSIITRYGEQEGAKRGYNPQKPGRNSHHPIMAFISETRMVANSWLRSGNTAALSNIYNFLEETFEILKSKKIGLVRADSGFYSDKFFKYFESKKINYIVSAKLYKPLKLDIQGIKSWIAVSKGIFVSEINYRVSKSAKLRRIVVVRQNVKERPKAVGKMLLFDEDQLEPIYRYSAMITNLDLPAVEVWNLYRNRADAENRIKELKYDFALNGYSLSKFYPTEAAFRFVMIAYNLMSLFRHLVLQTKTQHTLSVLRFKCFAIGSWIVKRGRKKILKLSVDREKRKWIDGLFSNVREIQPPF